MRIGHGFDVHAFGSINPLILGGVVIPFKYGLTAYSDGDVVIHALIDAFLGAAAMGDIGTLFPDNSPIFKNVNSFHLLNEVWKDIVLKDYSLGNIDLTILAQNPKLAPYLKQMHINISKNLNCQINKINIKSTTTEKLGFIGRGEGIACHAVVLLLSNN
ncbi:2-C-methyl-D-erythritol 2,4-cyclodiphosphate synthase [Candidatus Pantoea edessiphila]|uniref:2-C-methyl-D-erythritol 2,4-cyclodiphosphate synthase n=1 Tax=Candidatus Pantoea edessiphila TaxID=2044610 RepID=A0A2P5SXR8_9GAMM|nr:2-C-methyl-D-erythritol 2,4-cyclodiphosphate synthase [Candidatus Pantoea edessiphila]MBK4775677.1 2-C-methyl-D-erythritol 2,4-cyclodiphosphate synthase [Pantoea sp. Edef]PPI87092.1 2-C-methyl-D-erythritol 2,4-cyclodiphosphate synthase [Candidatus Pantoea edessiphila]